MKVISFVMQPQIKKCTKKIREKEEPDRFVSNVKERGNLRLRRRKRKKEEEKCVFVTSLRGFDQYYNRYDSLNVSLYFWLGSDSISCKLIFLIQFLITCRKLIGTLSQNPIKFGFVRFSCKPKFEITYVMLRNWKSSSRKQRIQKRLRNSRTG